MAISDQLPTQSGFHAKSTAAEVMADIDMTGKTAIVTGGYSGIGLETVRALADKGASVIVPVRSETKARENLSDLRGDIKLAPLDNGDLSTVQTFAATVLA